MSNSLRSNLIIAEFESIMSFLTSLSRVGSDDDGFGEFAFLAHTSPITLLLQINGAISHYYAQALDSRHFNVGVPYSLAIVRLLDRFPVDARDYTPVPLVRGACFFRCIAWCVTAESWLSRSSTVSDCGVMLMGRHCISLLIHLHRSSRLPDIMWQYVARWGSVVLTCYARLETFHETTNYIRPTMGEWVTHGGFSIFYINELMSNPLITQGHPRASN